MTYYSIMTLLKPTGAQIQRSHLEFIELLRKYLSKKIIGKTGDVLIPIKDLGLLKYFDMDASVQALYKDGIIGSLGKNGKVLSKKIPKEKAILFSLKKTKEEIAEYEQNLEKNGLIVHINLVGPKYEMFLNGHIEKRVPLSAPEGGILLFYIKNTGKILKRENLLEWATYSNGTKYKDTAQISTFSSSIRAKLILIGLNKNDVHRIFPSYSTGEGKAFNADGTILFSVKE